MDHRDAVRRGYDELATVYASERSANPTEQEFLGVLLDALPADARVLDAGCGQGTPILNRIASAATGVGIDVSDAQLRLADENVSGAALAKGDMLALPFSDRTFDAITAFNSIIHVPGSEHQTVVDEFARVLRPGGWVLLTTGGQEWTGSNPEWLGTDVEMRWSMAGPEATTEQLESAGFTVVEEGRIDNQCASDDDATFPIFLAQLN